MSKDANYMEKNTTYRTHYANILVNIYRQKYWEIIKRGKKVPLFIENLSVDVHYSKILFSKSAMICVF